MKRFIDLRKKIYCFEDDLPDEGDLPDEEITPCFSFFCTYIYKFEEFNGQQVWENWQEFEKDYTGDELERYKSLCPDWVFIVKKEVFQGIKK